MIGHEATYLRVLKRGGMVIMRAGRGDVYRTQDARRSVIGTLGEAYVTQLVNDGVLQQQGEEGGRLIWAGRFELPDGGERVGAPPCVPKRKAPAHSVLEYILRAEADADTQAYLLAAAIRFQRETETYHRGQSVTMNWSFVPRGKMRMASKTGGMGDMSLSAGRVLARLGEVLGKKDMSLLYAILILQVSMKQIMLDYGIKRALLAECGLSALTRLAKAYDRSIAPEHC